MTTDERISRLEDALWYLALMVTDGDPQRHLRNVNMSASDAAKRFLEMRSDVLVERDS